MGRFRHCGAKLHVASPAVLRSISDRDRGLEDARVERGDRALAAALAREPLAAYRAGLGFEAPDAAAVADAARRIAAHHGKLLDEQRRAYAADAAAEPASARVAAHLDALGALVDDLWTAGRASGLAARIAGATVVVRDRPREVPRGDDVPG